MTDTIDAARLSELCDRVIKGSAAPDTAAKPLARACLALLDERDSWRQTAANIADCLSTKDDLLANLTAVLEAARSVDTLLATYAEEGDPAAFQRLHEAITAAALALEGKP